MKLHQATPAVLADLPHLVSRLGLSGCPNSPNATSQCLPLPSPALCYWHPMKMSETSRPALIYSWCLCRCVSSVRQNFRPCVHVIKGKHFYNGLNVTIVTQKKRNKNFSNNLYLHTLRLYALLLMGQLRWKVMKLSILRFSSTWLCNQVLLPIR